MTCEHREPCDHFIAGHAEISDIFGGEDGLNQLHNVGEALKKLYDKVKDLREKYNYQ